MPAQGSKLLHNNKFQQTAMALPKYWHMFGFWHLPGGCRAF
jgi:hypothetical protein